MAILIPRLSQFRRESLDSSGSSCPVFYTLRFLPFLVDQEVISDMLPPFAPPPLQRLHHYYEVIRPCAPHRYSHPRGSSTWISSLASERQVPTFHSKAKIMFTPPFCRVFSLTLTTMTLYHSSLRWFEACSCKPTPRGLPSSFVQLRAKLSYSRGTLLPDYQPRELLHFRPRPDSTFLWMS